MARTPVVNDATKEYKNNPEIDAKIDKFMQANPGLVKAIQAMPRDRLERKYFLIRAEQQENRLGYREKVLGWLNDNPDVKTALEKQFSYLRNETHRENNIVAAAKGEIHNRGVRL